MSGHKKSVYARMLSAFIAVCMFLSPVPMPEAFARTGMPVEVPFETFFPRDLNQIQIPSNIGKLEEFYQGDERLVIVVQDAHAIPDAQRNIRNLIDFFQQSYGLDTVAVEGSMSELNPQIFRSFPDQALLKNVFSDYLEKGELTGTAMAAIFNRKETLYQGIEDWNLYEEGYGFYLESLKLRDSVETQIRERDESLNSRKESLYGAELLKVDQAIQDFHRNKLDLIKVLEVLAASKAPPPESEIALILKGQEESKENHIPVEVEVRSIAEKVRDYFNRHSGGGNRESLAEFNEKFQAFQTSRISADQFALFLRELCRALNLPLHFSSDLKTRVRQQRKMEDIEGTRFFDEFERYARSVKESLFTREEERELDEETHRLYLLERLTRLELTREQWHELKSYARRGSFTGPNNIRLDGQDIHRFIPENDLRENLMPHLLFYENAEARDEVFVRNLLALQKKQSGQSRSAAKKAVLIVAGGFHSEGVVSRLKEQGVSYLLLTPQIERLPEEIAYVDQMRGIVSWKDYFEIEEGQVNIYNAFVRYTRDRLLAAVQKSEPLQGAFRAVDLLKQWRDQIIRDLADKGKVADSGKYTRFIDEADENSKTVLSSEDLNEKVKRFISGLRELEASGKLNEQSIMHLVRPSGIQAQATGLILSEQPGRLEATEEVRERILERIQAFARNELRQINEEDIEFTFDNFPDFDAVIPEAEILEAIPIGVDAGFFVPGFNLVDTLGEGRSGIVYEAVNENNPSDAQAVKAAKGNFKLNNDWVSGLYTQRPGSRVAGYLPRVYQAYQNAGGVLQPLDLAADNFDPFSMPRIDVIRMEKVVSKTISEAVSEGIVTFAQVERMIDKLVRDLASDQMRVVDLTNPVNFVIVEGPTGPRLMVIDLGAIGVNPGPVSVDVVDRHREHLKALIRQSLTSIPEGETHFVPNTAPARSELRASADDETQPLSEVEGESIPGFVRTNERVWTRSAPGYEAFEIPLNDAVRAQLPLLKFLPQDILSEEEIQVVFWGGTARQILLQLMHNSGWLWTKDLDIFFFNGQNQPVVPTFKLEQTIRNSVGIQAIDIGMGFIFELLAPEEDLDMNNPVFITRLIDRLARENSGDLALNKAFVTVQYGPEGAKSLKVEARRGVLGSLSQKEFSLLNYDPAPQVDNTNEIGQLIDRLGVRGSQLYHAAGLAPDEAALQVLAQIVGRFNQRLAEEHPGEINERKIILTKKITLGILERIRSDLSQPIETSIAEIRQGPLFNAITNLLELSAEEVELAVSQAAESRLELEAALDRDRWNQRLKRAETLGSGSRSELRDLNDAEISEAAQEESETDELLRGLFEKGTLRQYSPGEVIIRQGDPGRSFFLLLSGSVGVNIVQEEDSRSGIVGDIQGSMDGYVVFGEMAYFNGGLRSATIRAQNEVEVLELNYEDLKEIDPDGIFSEYLMNVQNERDEENRQFFEEGLDGRNSLKNTTAFANPAEALERLLSQMSEEEKAAQNDLASSHRRLDSALTEFYKLSVEKTSVSRQFPNGRPSSVDFIRRRALTTRFNELEKLIAEKGEQIKQLRAVYEALSDLAPKLDANLALDIGAAAAYLAANPKNPALILDFKLFDPKSGESYPLYVTYSPGENHSINIEIKNRGTDGEAALKLHYYPSRGQLLFSNQVAKLNGNLAGKGFYSQILYALTRTDVVRQIHTTVANDETRNVIDAYYRQPGRPVLPVPQSVLQAFTPLGASRKGAGFVYDTVDNNAAYPELINYRILDPDSPIDDQPQVLVNLNRLITLATGLERQGMEILESETEGFEDLQNSAAEAAGILYELINEISAQTSEDEQWRYEADYRELRDVVLRQAQSQYERLVQIAEDPFEAFELYQGARSELRGAEEDFTPLISLADLQSIRDLKQEGRTFQSHLLSLHPAHEGTEITSYAKRVTPQSAEAKELSQALASQGNNLVLLNLEIERSPGVTNFVTVLDTGSVLSRRLNDLLAGRRSDGRPLLNNFELLVSFTEYQSQRAFHLRLISVGASDRTSLNAYGFNTPHSQQLQRQGYGFQLFQKLRDALQLRLAVTGADAYEVSTIDDSPVTADGRRWTGRQISALFSPARRVRENSAEFARVNQRERVLEDNRENVWVGTVKAAADTTRSELRSQEILGEIIEFAERLTDFESQSAFDAASEGRAFLQIILEDTEIGLDERVDALNFLREVLDLADESNLRFIDQAAGLDQARELIGSINQSIQSAEAQRRAALANSAQNTVLQPVTAVEPPEEIQVFLDELRLEIQEGAFARAARQITDYLALLESGILLSPEQRLLAYQGLEDLIVELDAQDQASLNVELSLMDARRSLDRILEELREAQAGRSELRSLNDAENSKSEEEDEWVDVGSLRKGFPIIPNEISSFSNRSGIDQIIREAEQANPQIPVLAPQPIVLSDLPVGTLLEVVADSRRAYRYYLRVEEGGLISLWLDGPTYSERYGYQIPSSQIVTMMHYLEEIPLESSEQRVREAFSEGVLMADRTTFFPYFFPAPSTQRSHFGSWPSLIRVLTPDGKLTQYAAAQPESGAVVRSELRADREAVPVLDETLNVAVTTVYLALMGAVRNEAILREAVRTIQDSGIGNVEARLEQLAGNARIEGLVQDAVRQVVEAKRADVRLRIQNIVQEYASRYAVFSPEEPVSAGLIIPDGVDARQQQSAAQQLKEANIDHLVLAASRVDVKTFRDLFNIVRSVADNFFLRPSLVYDELAVAVLGETSSAEFAPAYRLLGLEGLSEVTDTQIRDYLVGEMVPDLTGLLAKILKANRGAERSEIEAALLRAVGIVREERVISGERPNIFTFNARVLDLDLERQIIRIVAASA